MSPQPPKEETKQFKLKYIPTEKTTKSDETEKVADDLIIQHKKVLKKKQLRKHPASAASIGSVTESTAGNEAEDEYDDTFAIVSQDEIDKV